MVSLSTRLIIKISPPPPQKKINFYIESVTFFDVIRDDEIRRFNSYDSTKRWAVLLLVAAVYDDVGSQCYSY